MRLTDDERWRWHAYDYGWRRVRLAARTDASPADPDRDWLDAPMADQAEKMFRDAGRRSQARPDAVRVDFERLPIREWTPAEAAFKGREMDEVCARRGLPLGPAGWATLAAEARLAGYQPVPAPGTGARAAAREIPAPRGFETAKVTPARAAELLGALDARGATKGGAAPIFAPAASVEDSGGGLAGTHTEAEPPPPSGEGDYGV